MVQLWRTVVALTLVAGIGGCGMLKGDREATVPEPITPEQKATASPDNPDSAILADFNARLDNYVKKQRALLKDAPIRKTPTPAQIKARQETLAAELRDIRKNAKQGDIFTPQVAALFKRLMYPEVKEQTRGDQAGARGRGRRSRAGEAESQRHVAGQRAADDGAGQPAGKPAAAAEGRRVPDLEQAASGAARRRRQHHRRLHL